MLTASFSFWANDDGTITKPSGKVTKGSLHKSTGYYRIKINYKSYLVHRLMASAWVKNPRPDIFHIVDHIDGNPIYNHYSNLRWVTRKLNSLNQKSKYKKPMKWCISKPYRARGQVDGKRKLLGCYATKAEAMKVQDDHREKLFNYLYNWLTRPITGTPPPYPKMFAFFFDDTDKGLGSTFQQ